MILQLIRKKMENPKNLYDSAISVKHSSLNRNLLSLPLKKDSIQESKVKKEEGIDSDSDNDL